MLLEREDSPRGFDWKILKAGTLKIVITILLPAVLAAVVTRRTDTIMDFYGHLLTPRLAFWTGTGIIYVFNRWLLLWVPFYLFACTVSLVISRVRTPQQQDSAI
jgi:hypothetical protein